MFVKRTVRGQLPIRKYESAYTSFSTRALSNTQLGPSLRPLAVICVPFISRLATPQTAFNVLSFNLPVEH